MLRVLIAGGVDGVGGAACRAFLAKGAAVVCVDRAAANLAALERLCERVAFAVDANGESGNGRLTTLCLDPDDPATPAAVMREIASLWDGLDVLFVNRLQTRSLPLAEWRADLWDDDMRANLRTPFLFAQAAAPHLAAAPAGSIVFTGSTAASRGAAGRAAFHAAQAGMMGLVRSLAEELAASGTRVNCIQAGWLDTPFGRASASTSASAPASSSQVDAGRRQAIPDIPLRRVGSMEEAASAVLWLASRDAAYVTGTSIVIDGGLTAI